MTRHLIRPHEIGDIVRHANGNYYLVESHCDLTPIGGLIVYRRNHHGKRGQYDLTSCTFVPPDEVPDEVSAALAAWRLTGEIQVRPIAKPRKRRRR